MEAFAPEATAASNTTVAALLVMLCALWPSPARS